LLPEDLGVLGMKRLTELDRMNMAFQRATLDLEQGFAPDPFKYSDYNFKLKETLERLIQQIRTNKYRPSSTESFDMPKGEFAIRPGVIVDLLDLTVINRLLGEFILSLDRKLPSGVTAYRLKPDRKLEYQVKEEKNYFILSKYKRKLLQLEEPWYNLWPKFRKELLEDLKSGMYKFMARTDITAYFEDINLATLGEILKEKAGKKLKNINLITETYRSWAMRDPGNLRQNRGLPQGSNTSGVLSNYYLDILDSYLEGERKHNRIKWYRYCDDIYVLCPSRGRAVAVLLRIGALLRQLGLNQNAQKTKPLTAIESAAEVENPIAERVSRIADDSQKKGAKRADLIDKLRIEYKRISRRKVSDDKTETALFRIYTAARLLDFPLLKRRLEADFRQYPARVQTICKYARAFANYRDIKRFTFKFLERKEILLLYNYQLAFLLSVFRGLKTRVDAKVLKHVFDITVDIKRHWYVKVQAINTMGYLGVGVLQAKQVTELLHLSNHSQVRRAAITLLPMCHNFKDTHELVLRLARDLDPIVSRMANFAYELMTMREPALNHIKKFKPANEIFVCDQIWQLWFIGANPDRDVQRASEAIFKIFKREFRNWVLVNEHVRKIKRRMSIAKLMRPIPMKPHSYHREGFSHEAPRLGDILRQMRAVKPRTLVEALRFRERAGTTLPLGQILVKGRSISEANLQIALKRQREWGLLDEGI